MKKTIIISAIATAAFASTAFAATPAIDLGAGQTQIGYTYNNLKTNNDVLGDLGTFHGNGFQLAYGLSDKIVLTGDYLGSQARSFNVYNNGFLSGSVNNLSYTAAEYGLQYKLNDNLALMAGTVKTELKSDSASTPATETFGGIAYKQNLGKNMEGYASYVKSTNVQDVKAGLSYNLGNKTSLDVNYRDYQNNGTGNIKAKGLGFGVSHKF